MNSARFLISNYWPVAGGGAGGLESPPPPTNFQTSIKFCNNSGIFLLKWTAVNGSKSFKVLSIIVRLCSVVLLCNLELERNRIFALPKTTNSFKLSAY